MLGWRDIVGSTILVLVGSACGSDDASTGSGSGTGGNCDCKNGAYSPVCGVDGMTYDATCGASCVPVDVACSGECPCASTTSGPTTSASASGSASADETSATATGAGSTATGDDCDCGVGAYVPVCGVDGMTYDAACGRQCVPVDVACSGECPCPAFMCGDGECPPGEIVCTTVVPGTPDGRPTFDCSPLPRTCNGVADPDCTCVMPEMCDCMETPEGYFSVTCYAP